jgi:hypothetical protein
MVLQEHHREKIRALKHHWLTVSFLGGFVLDNITLNRVDQLGDNLILFSYVLIAGVSLALLYAGTADKLPEKLRRLMLRWMPLAIQFSFGGLLSGMLVFYSRSGSWSASWPFLLLIIGVMIGNETIKDRAQRLIFNLTVFFIGTFSYLVLIIPVIVKQMGPEIFFLSGLTSLFVVYWYVRFLRLIIPNFIEVHLRNIVFSIGMVFAIFNFLYFGNIIPPIPLSLKEVGIYRMVEPQDDGGYRLTYEPGPWYAFWRDGEETYKYQEGDRVYCFASVFAPTAFSTEIYHRWEYYDEKAGEWQEHGRIAYRIDGGRGGGFRGYTYIENVMPGKWRCSVETGRGQVLGRDVFEIEPGTPSKVLTETVSY